MQTVTIETTSIQISVGFPHPFGATVYLDGVNFSVVCIHASKLSLCLYSSREPHKLLYEFNLDPIYNKTGNVWHIFLHKLPLDMLYLYRVDDKDPSLLDPYAKEVITTPKWIENREDGYHPYGGIYPLKTFAWEDDKPPLIPLEDLVIYEMHVRGYTVHESSGVANPGTFLGLIEKIPHLLDLGVNAVELLPIHEFNECENTHINPITKQPLCQFWGYSTVNFFSPMQRYASNDELGSAITDFKTMVKELHRNGIEVILDVVYNHTAEGNDQGPVISFDGFDSPIYYMLDEKGHHLNFTGCGNTFNCNHPIVRELIKESLRYWVTEMHVDGFRFDLASTLTRGTKGQPLVYSPILEVISNDPILAKVKLIAEPWDAAGLYQVGSFFEHGSGRWSEWNARYRDTIRRFIKGTGFKGEFVNNICGSQDFYHSVTPYASINFVTAHDGFTLQDLVSYNRKHNLGNGEHNRDGTNDNESWNCGIEGPTLNKTVAKIRSQQIRNLHFALMISRGIPMLLMGDEYAHTKHGNNNTWCQDNDLNWFLWDQLDKHADFHRFYKGMIHFRKQHALLRQNKFLRPEDAVWHGQKLGLPNWAAQDRLIAFTLLDHQGGNDLFIAFHSGPGELEIELPTKENKKKWFWVVNTANPPPNDFYDEGSEVLVTEEEFTMPPYSAIMLKAKS